MWNNNGSRGRSSAPSKFMTRLKNANSMKMLKVKAELKVSRGLGSPPEIAAVRMVLNDLSAAGTTVYAPAKLDTDQEVSLTLTYPKQFFIRGRVIFSADMEGESRVLSEIPCNARVGIAFLFDSPEEKSAVEAFCNEIHTVY